MEAPNPSVSINLKPNKPVCFNGSRDFLVVNTWLYKVEQYFVLVQVANANVVLSDANRISFATTLLTGTAAVWWYTVLKANEVPQSWDSFVAAIRREFIPEDHERRARDSLRACKQSGSVATYLSNFRNIVLTIPDMSASEKWDKFVSGLKPKIQFEVRKSSCVEFEEATKIAMRVEAAFAGVSSDPTSSGSVSSPSATGGAAYEPMEIDNTEIRRTERSKQRLQDIRNNACFKCHKSGCRPWKHRSESSRTVKVANVETALAKKEEAGDFSSDSDSSEN